MKIELLAMSLIFALAVGPARGQGDEDHLKRRFVSEYPAALEAWKARCSNAMGTVRITMDDTNRKNAPPTETTYSFKCKSPHMAILTSVESKDRVPEERVSGYNKNYSFLLERADPAADYSILSLKATGGTGNVPRSSYLWNLLLMPYASRYAHDHLVSSPGFAVQGVSPLGRNGKNLLRVAFE